MKRLSEILLTVALVALLAGCVIGHDVDTSEEVELRVRAVMTQRTRTAPSVADIPAEEESELSTTFPSDMELGLWAFSLPRDREWAIFYPDAEPFATNEKFSHSEESGLWYPTKGLGWLYPQSLTLIGYAPYDLEVEYSHKHGLVLRDYDTANQSEVVDVLYTDYISDLHSEKHTKFVDVPFRHALAKVDMKAYTTLPDDYRYTIHKIYFESVATKGTFYSQPSSEWILEEELNELVIYDSEEGCVLVVNESIAIEGAEGLVLPQQVSGCIVVDVEVLHAGFASRLSFRTQPLKTVWEEGRYYTYTLSFTLDGVSIKEPSEKFD